MTDLYASQSYDSRRNRGGQQSTANSYDQFSRTSEGFNRKVKLTRITILLFYRIHPVFYIVRVLMKNILHHLVNLNPIISI